jgi:hypothetical protein
MSTGLAAVHISRLTAPVESSYRYCGIFKYPLWMEYFSNDT